MEPPLLEDDAIVNGSVDYQGCPARRDSFGGWRSASFIIVVEMAERFAYYGISSNLIIYLTGPMGQSTATAAENVNAWIGTATLLPLLGAFVADAYLGRYCTIIISSLIYILGLGLLTLSAMLNSHSNLDCPNTNSVGSCSTPHLLVVLFIFSLYLAAIGQGGHKPCVQAFGADQFDGNDPKESVAKSSFFNWWYLALSTAALVSLLIIVYIQDNISWALSFGILCVLMLISLVIFLLGAKTYRYSVNVNDGNPFKRIGKVFVLAVKNKNRHNAPSVTVAEEEVLQTLPHQQSSEQFKFLDKALLARDGSSENSKACNVNDVEEAKTLLRLVPIWTACLGYAIVFAQASTFFTKQGATMDRKLAAGFTIPAASLQFFIGVSIIVFIPIYDRLFVPIARTITHKPSGITMLQRIGFGMFLSAFSMVIAALVEMKRLKTAQEYGLVDTPSVTIPMSIWWLVPQYLLFGLADVFAIVGLQELFYDQVPHELRSVGLSLYLSVLGVGNFLSSFLVSVIDKATGGNGGESWFASNLNRAHLDYFYWLLAGLSAVGLVAFLFFSKSFVYNNSRRWRYLV
ncbi:Proton-dependent oligopeptide transporter family [Corchorus olitorius]|uniref:Proton-dependent oligopeptide transporter family n=1 Tax=Corchorus olitorius TaxID=93759 RepID=A0A1R3I8A8_9ROSI|nr:Proton-dependent oligopeptide transporter family [Corchorus olitorius]